MSDVPTATNQTAPESYSDSRVIWDAPANTRGPAMKPTIGFTELWATATPYTIPNGTTPTANAKHLRNPSRRPMRAGVAGVGPDIGVSA